MSSGRSLRLGEAALGAGTVLLGLFILYETWMLRVGPANAVVGPRVFPILVAAGLVVIGLAMLREATGGHVAHEQGIELDWPTVAMVAGALVLQMLLLEWAGWIITAALLFAIVARAFGSRRLVLDLAIGLALGVITYLVFGYGLELSLPGGLIGELLNPEDNY